jgi:hypothetical protein
LDWSGLLRDSWRTARGTSALWQLGLVSAAQVVLYSAVIGGMIAPLTVLTQLLVQAQSPLAGTGASAEAIQASLPGLLVWLTRNGPVLAATGLGVMLLWGASGVLDVAATGGSISQTLVAVEGRRASFAAGMRDGFGAWWRMVGLLAIAAMPGLLYLLVIALFTLFAISLPMLAGRAPDLATIGVGNTASGLLSPIVGMVGIPLAVLVQLGVRFVVLEGQDWRRAWSSAWALAKTRLADVVLMYLLQLAIASVAAIAYSVVIVVIVVAAGTAVVFAVAAANGFSGTAVVLTAVAAIMVLIVSFALVVLTLVWQSVVWTLFWRRIAHTPLAHGYAPDAGAVETTSQPSA